MKKHLIGIKYCGGCHLAYDRKDAFRTIQQALDSYCIFEPVREDVLYEVVLVMNGCSAQCADVSRLNSISGFISCSNLISPQAVCVKIQTMINKKEARCEA